MNIELLLFFGVLIYYINNAVNITVFCSHILLEPKITKRNNILLDWKEIKSNGNLKNNNALMYEMTCY